MSFSLPAFWRFCSHLTINSKEMGTIRLARPYGPQRWIMHEVARGLEDGIHDFTYLKARQLGASTVLLALDLYWPFTHPGIDGTLVTHDEETFVNFRTQLSEYYASLPRGYKPRTVGHNRYEFVFRFDSGRISRLQYQIAGTRSTGNSKLGRAKGNAQLHGTECAFWGDQAGYQSLRNSLAENNPNRLYLWESTANGFNAFEEQWRMAKRAITQRAIFVGWWAHEAYRMPRDSQIYHVYFGVDGKWTREERQLAHDVKILYGDAMRFVNGTDEIQPEQLAWYRWYSEEKVGDLEMVKQEMPWTEHQAFITTGAQYFSSRELTEHHKRIVAEAAPETFRVEIQQTFTDCRVVKTVPKTANLWLYEAPQEKCQYVLGADPAYGSSDWADRFAISVWRCWADRIEQVAEYCTEDQLPYGFAWVMCYIAGCYSPCAWNLEINGPGAAVLGEIDNLKRQQFAGTADDMRTMKNFLGGMKEFLYTRYDAISRTPTGRGTQSTLKEKTRYMALFKDYTSRGLAIPHSRGLLEEMRWITAEPGYAPSGSARHKDDRVIAAALAVQMWHDKLRSRQLYLNQVYRAPDEGPQRPNTVYDQIVARQRRLLGLGKQA